jgi:tRNA-modifying protein YgfZ
VSGPDRVSFLNGQLTNDISLLTPQTTMLAGWCSNKGRLVMVCQLIDWADAIWLLMPSSIIEGVSKKLKMYVMRADVEIEIADTTLIGLGDGADEDTHSSEEDVFADENGFIVKVVGDHSRSIYLIPDAVDVENDMLDEVSSDYFWLRGIQAGIPRILAETQEEFIAQQVNLDLLYGISFKKGCYLGQEIIARTQNLGTIKRRMYLYTIAANDEAIPGSKIITDDKAAGYIVDSISDGEEAYILAVISIDKLDKELSLENDSKAILKRSSLLYEIPEST